MSFLQLYTDPFIISHVIFSLSTKFCFINGFRKALQTLKSHEGRYPKRQYFYPQELCRLNLHFMIYL